MGMEASLCPTGHRRPTWLPKESSHTIRRGRLCPGAEGGGRHLTRGLGEELHPVD